MLKLKEVVAFLFFPSLHKSFVVFFLLIVIIIFYYYHTMFNNTKLPVEQVNEENEEMIPTINYGYIYYYYL